MEQSLVREIRDLDIMIGKSFTKSDMPKESLNHTQIQIVFYLLRHMNEDVCQKDLEIETHLKKASITGTLDSLEDKGLILRKTSQDDRRKNTIVLSERAINIKDNLEKKFQELEEQIKNNIDENELESFFKTAEKIKNNLNKKGR